MTHLCPHTGQEAGDILPKSLRDEIAEEARLDALADATRDAGVCVEIDPPFDPDEAMAALEAFERAADVWGVGD